MNILFDESPHTVTVHGQEYEIETDFREWIKLSLLFMKTERFTRRTLNNILEWYIDDPPEDDRKAVFALQEFLLADPAGQCQEEKTERQGGAIPQKPAFSYEQDAVYIYSAFLEIYGIDIETIPYMHWWKFKALFEGLPADTEIKERMYYRTVDLNEIRDKAERKRIKKIRKMIEIKETNTRKMDAFEIGDVFA